MGEEDADFVDFLLILPGPRPSTRLNYVADYAASARLISVNIRSVARSAQHSLLRARVFDVKVQVPVD